MYQSKRWHAVVIKYHGGIFAEHHDDGTTSESGAHVILFVVGPLGMMCFHFSK